MQRIAVELSLDHLDVIRRNLFRRELFLTRPPPAASTIGDTQGGGNRDRRRALEYLKKRRDEARKAGRKYGIGFAVVVEPAMSNMGYLSTMLTPETRDKAGPKNGATSMVTVNIDPLGAVSVTADVTVQGQGHETVLSQIVADSLAPPRRRRRDARDGHRERPVVDRRRDLLLSLHAGHCRRRAHGGETLADKLKRSPRSSSTSMAGDVELSGGKIRSISNPDNALPFGRVAGTSHWSPVMLPEGMAPALSETGVWNPPELEPPSHDDRINTSFTYGFVFDMCGIEIDPITYQVQESTAMCRCTTPARSSIR